MPAEYGSMTNETETKGSSCSSSVLSLCYSSSHLRVTVREKEKAASLRDVKSMLHPNRKQIAIPISLHFFLPSQITIFTTLENFENFSLPGMKSTPSKVVFKTEQKHDKNMKAPSLSRDWAGSIWRPVHKVQEHLQDKHSKVVQNCYR